MSTIIRRKHYGDCRSEIAPAGVQQRAIYRFFECRESKKDGRRAEESARRVRPRIPHVDRRPEGDYHGKEEVHEPLAAVRSDWRVPGCVEGAGGAGGGGGAQVFRGVEEGPGRDAGEVPVQGCADYPRTEI